MAQFVPETDEAVKGEMIGAGSYAADQIRIQLTASFFSLSLFFPLRSFLGPVFDLDVSSCSIREETCRR